MEEVESALDPWVYKDACRLWRRDVRLMLLYEYHDKGIEEVSDNHIYNLIFNLKKVPPPPIRPDNERVGLARSNIFTECENGRDCYYERTGRSVLSDDPSAKRRRITVFRYLPELDHRQLYGGPVRYADWHGLDDF